MNKIINKGHMGKTIEFSSRDDRINFLKDFNDDIKIVFNENKLGFYIKETNELIQMKEGVVKQVTDYIN